MWIIRCHRSTELWEVGPPPEDLHPTATGVRRQHLQNLGTWALCTNWIIWSVHFIHFSHFTLKIFVTCVTRIPNSHSIFVLHHAHWGFNIFKTPKIAANLKYSVDIHWILDSPWLSQAFFLLVALSFVNLGQVPLPRSKPKRPTSKMVSTWKRKLPVETVLFTDGIVESCFRKQLKVDQLPETPETPEARLRGNLVRSLYPKEASSPGHVPLWSWGRCQCIYPKFSFNAEPYTNHKRRIVRENSVSLGNTQCLCDLNTSK